MDCTYCEYGTGLMAYMGEILARTEQYFCPTKHAHKILGTHARYKRFLDYGEADAYEARPEEFRVALGRAEWLPAGQGRDGEGSRRVNPLLSLLQDPR